MPLSSDRVPVFSRPTPSASCAAPVAARTSPVSRRPLPLAICARPAVRLRMPRRICLDASAFDVELRRVVGDVRAAAARAARGPSECSAWRVPRPGRRRPPGSRSRGCGAQTGRPTGRCRTGSESLVSESRFWSTSESVSVVIASRSRLLPLFARFEALARRWAPWLVWSHARSQLFRAGCRVVRACGDLTRSVRRLLEPVRQRVSALRALLEALVESPGADQQALEAALQLGELLPSGGDLARQPAQHGRPVEQRSRSEDRLDARLSRRPRSWKRFSSPQARFGRDRAAGMERDLERGRPAGAAIALERLVALARRVVGREVRDVRRAGVERERGSREQEQREDSERRRGPRLAREPLREPHPRVLAPRRPELPAVDVRPEHHEPGGDREERDRHREHAGHDHAERRRLEQRAGGDRERSEHPDRERRARRTRPCARPAQRPARPPPRRSRPRRAPRGTARRSAASSRPRARGRSS